MSLCRIQLGAQRHIAREELHWAIRRLYDTDIEFDAILAASFDVTLAGLLATMSDVEAARFLRNVADRLKREAADPARRDAAEPGRARAACPRAVPGRRL